MATHVRQHYVPRFLLEQWHSGADNKLTQFHWLRGQLRADRFKAKAVANEAHLYSQQKTQPVPNVSIERDFLGPLIDDPAAKVHSKILSIGHDHLSPQECYEWSRFLLSLLVRSPEMVIFLRKVGQQAMSKAMAEKPDTLGHLRGNDPKKTLREWAEEHRPHLIADVGVRALPAILTSATLNQYILNGFWQTIPLVEGSLDALIADNPVVNIGEIKAGFSFMLPLSPRKLFVVTSHPSDAEMFLGLDGLGWRNQ
jgi:hypothetical protein